MSRLFPLLLALGPGLLLCSLSSFSNPTNNNAEAADHAGPGTTQPSLQPISYQPLALGTIMPKGWLLNQLKIQASGLSGHLDEFWPDIKDSAWFGGGADDWERAPYWLDGVVPLAFLLDEPELKKRVAKYMDMIINRQQESGYLAPREDPSGYDLWAVFLVLKPLLQYYEATSNQRIPEVIEKTLHWVNSHIGRRPLFNWGKFRWFEALIPINRIYLQTGDKRLSDLAVKLHAQGFDWLDFFRRWPLTEPTVKDDWNYMGHVVNNAMAVKAPALWWSWTGNPADRSLAAAMIEQLDRFHGQANGTFSGDECLAGKNPSHGTELCAVVEYMYSLEVLLSVLGNPQYGDRLEKIAYNALPATFSPDMWSHQYDQQVNQVLCSINPDHLWTTNGPESNIFGLEPNYGCCTANLSQGWPKLASHLWMRIPEEGLAAMVYAPCEIKTELKGIPVRVKVETGYPFREEVKISISSERPVAFPLKLRIPAWAQGASLKIQEEPEVHPTAGTFHTIERNWNAETRLELKFPMTPRVHRRFQNAIAIERGPLVYALKIGEEWKRVNIDKPHREPPHADWEVHPTTAWNYALDLDEETAENLTFSEHPIGSHPFSPQGAPVSTTVKGLCIESWILEKGAAGKLPISPLDISGKLETLTLIPYGCTNLRVTEFPTLK